VIWIFEVRLLEIKGLVHATLAMAHSHKLDMNVLMPEMIFLHNFKMVLQLVAAFLSL